MSSFALQPTRRAVLAGGLALAGSSLTALAQSPAPRLRLIARPDGRSAIEPQSRPVVLFNDGLAPPPLFASRNTPLILDIENACDQDMSLHWRGLRALAGVTGLQDVFVRPGETAAMTLEMSEVGFALLEGRLHGEPAPDCRLTQLLIIEDDAPPIADRQVLLSLTRDTRDPSALLVNAAAPVDLGLGVNERVHFRIANANPMRPLAITFDGMVGLMIGLDGFPTNEPLPISDHPLTLLPLGRADILIDAPSLAEGTARLRATDGDGDAVAITIAIDSARSRAEPWPMPANPDQRMLPSTIELEKAVRATFKIGATQGGGLLTAKAGMPVVLTLENPTDTPMLVNMRGQACRLLHAFDDGWEPFWLDTLLLAPQATQLVAFVPPLAGEWRIEAKPLGQTLPSQIAAYRIE